MLNQAVKSLEIREQRPGVNSAVSLDTSSEIRERRAVVSHFRRWLVGQQHFIEGDYDSLIRRIWHGRDSGNFFYQARPFYVLTIRDEVVRGLEHLKPATGRSPTWSEAIQIALNSTQGTLTEFSHDAINRYVKAYYEVPAAFSPESGIATMLTNNLYVNIALMECLIRKIGKKAVQVEELATGRDLTRLKTYSRIYSGSMHPPINYIATDFTSPPDREVICKLSNQGIRFSGRELDLLKPFPTLPEGERLDGMLITYGFDSVWLPGDVTYEKRGDQWHRFKYRLVAPDWHPRRADLVATFRLGEASGEFSLDDIADIAIEAITEEVDVRELPDVKFLQERAGDSEWAVLSSPRGWVNKILEAFETQLGPQGVFISADLGVYREGDFSYLPFTTCGKAACHKIEDFRLAEAMLTSAGLQVEVLSLRDFVSKYYGPSWEENARKSDRDGILSENHYVLVAQAVNRPASQNGS